VQHPQLLLAGLLEQCYLPLLHDEQGTIIKEVLLSNSKNHSVPL
jgi:hypothetical protein